MTSYTPRPSQLNPFVKGETFTPSLQLNLRQYVPKEKRREWLKEFKKKSAFQQEGLALVQEEIMAVVRLDPDLSKEELLDWIKDLGAVYGMNPEQKQKADEAVGFYVARHALVKKTRAEYPDDAELYAALFGRKPTGKVEVIAGPLTLYFRCHEINDYALIRSQAFLQSREVTTQDVAAAKLSGGVSVGGSLVKGLEGTIIAENAQGRAFDQSAKAVYVHEEQHAIKQLFQQEQIKSNALQELKNSRTEAEKELALGRYFRYYRQRGEEKAKDEILAYMKDGYHSLEDIFKALTKSRAEGGLYDYFADTETVMEEFLVEQRGVQISSPLIQRVARQVFGAEYHRLIQEGIDAMVDLKAMEHSTEEAIGILIHRPLRKWGKTVKRLIEARRFSVSEDEEQT